MLVRFLAVLLTSCFWLVADAMSKVYWLPDYQTGELHKKGYQDRGQNNAQNSVIRDNAFGCAAYGYLEAEEVDKPEDCEKNFQLPDGRFCYYNCCEKAPEDYTLYAIPSNASYSHFYDECEEKDKYRLDSCNTNYYLSVDACKACTWNNYTLTAKNVSNAADYYSDTCGGVTKYAIKSCNSGYEINGNVCQACTWNNYTLTSKNVSNADTYYESTCGGVTKYAIKTCVSCYSKSGNTCVKDTCPTVNCTNGSCYTDTCGCEVLYDCNSGYEMNGNSCKACTWSGYTLTSKNVSNAASYYSATCDGTTKYAVKTCNSCYYKSGNACYEERCDSVSCSNATCYTDSCGCDYISSCDSCYHRSGNSCVKDSCSVTTCPSNSSCTTDSCGCKIVGGCKSGYASSCSGCYTLTGTDSNGCGTCSKKSCTTTCPSNSTCGTDSCGCYTSPTGCASGYVKSCSSGYELTGADSNGCGTCKSTCPASCNKTCPSNSSCTTDSCGCVTVGGCASGYKMCGGNCVQYCYYISSSYWDSCPSSATCGYDSSSCCYYTTGCQPGYHQCYERCEEDGYGYCM